MNIVDQMQEPIPKYVLEEVAHGLDHRDDYGWIPWAWAVLSGAGDMPVQVDEEIAEYPGHLVTIVGLGHLFDLFQDILSGGAADLEPDVELVGEIRPQITTIEIARYCEREGIYDRQDPETGSGLFREAVVARSAELRHRLLEILGGGRLFTSLHLAGQRVLDAERADVGTSDSLILTEDLVDAHLNVMVNEDLSVDKQRTFAWLEGDLDLG